MKFEIVSLEQFIKDVGKQMQYNVEDPSVITSLDVAYHSFVKTPKRATEGSCGYDFVSPFSFTIIPKKKIVIPTGIRVSMPTEVFLMIVPRSSLGFKYQIGLANTVGIIDSDYYYADNEGHIMIALENRGDKEVHIEAGDRFAQGIFLPALITENDHTTAKRSGGMGSTGR